MSLMIIKLVIMKMMIIMLALACKHADVEYLNFKRINMIYLYSI